MEMKILPFFPERKKISNPKCYKDKNGYSNVECNNEAHCFSH